MNTNFEQLKMADGVSQAVNAYLIDECKFENFKLFKRVTTAGQNSYVAYVSGSSSINELDLILDKLRLLLSPQKLDYLVPLTVMPYLPNGELDIASLCEIPVFNRQYLQQFEEEQTLTVAQRHGFKVARAKHQEQLAQQQPLAMLCGPELEADPHGRETLLDALAHSAKTQSGIRTIVNAQQQGYYSYEEFQREALNIAYGLVARQVAPGSQVIIQLTDPMSVLLTVWGAWYAGASAVPLAPCIVFEQSDSNAQKLLHALDTFAEATIVCDSEASLSLRQLAQQTGHNRCKIQNFDQLTQHGEQMRLPEVKPSDIAFYLLTSGSTAKAKIVPQSHHNILHRSLATQQFNQFSNQDVSLNWLPLDHVGGIVMFHIQDLVTGCEQIQVATRYVLSDPLRWMSLCDQYRVSITWAPNFAYQLLNAKASLVARQNWDLSSLHFILNGGEAIVAEQSHQFLKLLAPHGLNAQTMYPSWGMSETCSGVTFYEQFSQLPNNATYTPVGLPIAGTSVRIVDDEGSVRRSGERGRLQVKGKSILSGYLANETQNQLSFTDDGWFDTGDIALIDEQGLTITGRNKDILIINGKNIACHELEASIDTLNGVLPSFTCVFALNEGEQNCEQLCAVISTELSQAEQQNLFSQIQSTLKQQFGAQIAKIYVLAPEQIAKTSIGKIQRNWLRNKITDNVYQASWSALCLESEQQSAQDLIDQCFTRQWVANFTAKHTLTLRKVALYCQHSDTAIELTEALAAQGIETQVALPVMEEKAQSHWLSVVPTEVESWQQLLSQWHDDTQAIDEFIFVPALCESPSLEVQYQAVEQILALLQAFNNSRLSAPLMVVTRGAQRVLDTDSVSAPLYSTLSSFIRTANEELPKFNGVCLDTGDAHISDAVLSTLRNRAKQVEVAYRNQQQYVSKLAHIDFSLHKSRSSPNEHKNIMIFGGLGGIAAHLVTELGQDPKVHLILVGRSDLETLDTAQRSRLAHFQNLPAKVDYLSADVSDYLATNNVLIEAQERFDGMIEQVFNLTGNFQVEPLAQMSWPQCQRQLATKVQGSMNLYQLSHDFGIKQLVLFSSTNGYLSGAGVASYSAANRFQEAVADMAKADSALDVRCLSWSMWRDIGLSKGFEHVELTRSKGYCVFDYQQGIDVLPQLLGLSIKHCMIGLEQHAMPLRTEFLPALSGLQQVVITRALQQGLVDPFGIPIKVTLQLPKKQHEAVVKEGSNRALQGLMAIWCEALELDDLDVDENVFDLGANSLMLPQVIERIESQLGFSVTLVDIFQYPSIGALAAYINSVAEDVSVYQRLLDSMSTHWQEQLELEHLDVDENIFDLGANSLHLPAFLEAIQQQFGLELSLVDVFQYPTTQQLAEYAAIKLEE